VKDLSHFYGEQTNCLRWALHADAMKESPPRWNRQSRDPQGPALRSEQWDQRPPAHAETHGVALPFIGSAAAKRKEQKECSRWIYRLAWSKNQTWKSYTWIVRIAPAYSTHPQGKCCKSSTRQIFGTKGIGRMASSWSQLQSHPNLRSI
jgi:hypothetical protein